MTNLYLLRPVDNRPEWSPWYDKAFGFVVAAATEADARQMANKQAGDENSRHESQRPWLDVNASTAQLIGQSDVLEPGVVIRDFAAA